MNLASVPVRDGGLSELDRGYRFILKTFRVHDVFIVLKIFLCPRTQIVVWPSILNCFFVLYIQFCTCDVALLLPIATPPNRSTNPHRTSNGRFRRASLDLSRSAGQPCAGGVPITLLRTQPHLSATGRSLNGKGAADHVAGSVRASGP